MTLYQATGTPYGPIEPDANRLLRVNKPRRRTDRVTESAEFLSMLWRLVRAAETRAIEDPEMIPQLDALAMRMAEAVNVVIAANAERFGIDPRLGLSMGECARILGITKQSASDRRKRGRAIINERLRRLGVVRLRYTEAPNERKVITETAQKAIVGLEQWRKRKAV